MSLQHLKTKIGCWLNERWRTELVLRFPHLAQLMDLTWLDLCNRNERLVHDKRTGGRICQWKDSSGLTVGRIFPDVGKRLFDTLFKTWKINFKSHDAKSDPLIETPIVSVIIAFRGSARMPLLLKTIEALRGQTGINFEILVVEQSPQKSMIEKWPTDVVHLHQEFQDPEGNFNKSSALNYGASRARGDWLAILDGDYIVPNGYLASVKKVEKTIESYWPSRFIFYLNRESTSNLLESDNLKYSMYHFDMIIQNNPTPFFIKKESYWKIGGHDEQFSGWGGEDSEFRDRVRTLNCSEAGFIPIIHQWHPPALKKANGDRNQILMDDKLGQSPQVRIADLTLKNQHYLGLDS